MPRVIFEPVGGSAEVDPGVSVLEAARRAGVSIRNDCGGRGACGRCIVRLQSGEVHRLVTRYKLRKGEDLACRMLVLESDIVVFVPRSSLEVAGEVTMHKPQPAPAQLPAEAIVRTTQVELSAPTLEDNVSDAERLLAALKNQGAGACRVPSGVLRSLPSAVREARWKPNVVLSADAVGCEVLGVAPHERGGPCVLVVDIGTTALKAELIAPGKKWAASCYNSQTMYGPDVISRIVHCQQQEGGLHRLQGLVVADINRLLGKMLEAAGASRDDVWAVVVSGNTTMMHLLLGMEPLWIRREPYVGCSYHIPPLSTEEIGINAHRQARLFCLPSVSAYVGADVTAGVLATGLADREKPSMLIDLGTNGEIVVGNREFMVCCSASAGPAFEGEASASGTRARPGAIDAVRGEGGALRWHTIDEQPPVGICGSGYIDLLAVLFCEGVIDRRGRLQEGISSRLRPTEGDGFEYVLAYAEDVPGERDIVLTQADIGNLVRAKGAIYAAANVLLESLGMVWRDLDSLMLAGGFGEEIDKSNAVTIGLLPDVPRDRIEFVGNTSLQGAVMTALDAKAYARTGDIAKRMTYLELSTYPDYMPQFVAACFLPHTQAEQFPSVTCRDDHEEPAQNRRSS